MAKAEAPHLQKLLAICLNDVNTDENLVPVVCGLRAPNFNTESFAKSSRRSGHASMYLHSYFPVSLKVTMPVHTLLSLSHKRQHATIVT